MLRVFSPVALNEATSAVDASLDPNK
jgi:hypothetical protein